MRTKRMIIKEQQALIDQLQERLKQQAGAIDTLQKNVVEYRGREQSITNAMTEVAAMRQRVTEEAKKQAEQMLGEAESARAGAINESQEIVNTAYQNARDIVKNAEAERRQKLEQTESAINTYSEILRQYNEMVKDQVKTAEENARQYAAYYQQLSFAVPELIGDTRELGKAGEAEAVLTEIDDDPAKLMRNIYTIEHRDIPAADVPDRTSAVEQPAREAAPEEELPVQDAPEEETYPEDEHTGEAAVPDAQAETDADGETMPPSVSDLCNGGETDAAELDKLLDDIINAAE